MSSSELKVAEKWDTALEKGIKRMAYGAIAGGVVAALMFRTYRFSPLSPHSCVVFRHLTRFQCLRMNRARGMRA